MKHLILFVLNLFLFFDLKAQNTIRLVNPSFEDLPKKGETPNGWYNCGFKTETPPDVQPGSFQVESPAYDGHTYLGLVVRDNETWESVGQRLASPLQKDGQYTFSIWLARAELYVSQSQTTKETANYVTPVKLRIWGGNGYCDKVELLYETAIVTNFRWKEYEIFMNPTEGDFSYLTFEAYYKTPVLFPYNGNLLLDNCSPIESVSAENFGLNKTENDPDTEMEETVTPQPVISNVSYTTKTPEPVIPAVKEPVVLDPKNIRVRNASFESYPPKVGDPLPAYWETIPYPDEILPRTHTQYGEKMAVKGDKNEYYTIPILKKLKAEAQDGTHYMSLVTKKDGTRQWISQALEQKMEKDSAYVFSLFLMHADHFKESSLKGEKPVDYKYPVKLRVWGGNEVFRKEEVLAESVRIEVDEWKRHVFVLNPKKQHYTYLTLEAWYAYEDGKTYEGNILIDACSNLARASKSNK